MDLQQAGDRIANEFPQWNWDIQIQPGTSWSINLWTSGSEVSTVPTTMSWRMMDAEWELGTWVFISTLG